MYFSPPRIIVYCEEFIGRVSISVSYYYIVYRYGIIKMESVNAVRQCSRMTII